jgi:NAD(P)H-nitrite reductase large subunit
MPLTSLLRVIWNGEFESENDAKFINDRVHANIQRDGTFSVVPQIKGGVTDADQLRRIADVADKHDIPMIKITAASASTCSACGRRTCRGCGRTSTCRRATRTASRSAR